MEPIQEALFLLVKYPLSEADFIAHFLSRSHGPLQARITGGQLHKRGFGYEAGDQVEVTYQGQDQNNFIKIQEIRPIFQQDTQKLGYASLMGLATMMELANRLGQRDWDAEGLYDLLEQCQSWDWSRPQLLMQLFQFIWSLTQLGGIHPVYHHCLSCQRESYVAEGDSIRVRKSLYHLNPPLGGLTCQSCTPGGSLEGATVKLFWLADQGLPLGQVPEKLFKDALWQLFDYLAYHSQFQLKALPLLQEALTRG